MRHTLTEFLVSSTTTHQCWVVLNDDVFLIEKHGLPRPVERPIYDKLAINDTELVVHVVLITIYAYWYTISTQPGNITTLAVCLNTRRELPAAKGGGLHIRCQEQSGRLCEARPGADATSCHVKSIDCNSISLYGNASYADPTDCACQAHGCW